MGFLAFSCVFFCSSLHQPLTYHQDLKFIIYSLDSTYSRRPEKDHYYFKREETVVALYKKGTSELVYSNVIVLHHVLKIYWYIRTLPNFCGQYTFIFC